MSNTSLLGSYGGQAGDALMFRNRIINGDMRIDQRNAGNAQTITAAASAAYCVDRWQAFCAGANVTAQRVAGSSGNQYALRLTGLAGNTTTEVAQRIESLNCYDLANRDVTLSFRVSSTSITTLTWIVDSSNGGADAWSGATQIATGTVTISSTDTAFSVTFNAGATAINGLRVRFQTGALLGSQTISFQQVQLEAGPTATPFERRPIGTEIALCQRYYYKIVASANYAPFGTGMCKSTTGADIIVQHPVPLRTVATYTEASGVSSFQVSDAVSSTAVTSLNFPVNQQSNLCAVINFNVASGLTTFRPIRVEAANNISAYLGFGAEL